MDIPGVSIYISNNVDRFGELAKENHWCPREAVISIKDIFSISVVPQQGKPYQVISGELNTIVCFKEIVGELEILNVSITKDISKITSNLVHIQLLEKHLSDYMTSNPIQLVNKSASIKKRVSIYYNLLGDIAKSQNSRLYDMLLLELEQYSNVGLLEELISMKRRSKSACF